MVLEQQIASLTGVTMGKTQPPVRSTRNGFTLIEAMATALLVSVLSLSLLQSLTVLIGLQMASKAHWEDTIDLWNRANQALAGEGEEPEQIETSADTPPLRRYRLKGKNTLEWEVFLGK
jgi:prepilin-type N-terminal cleavage/methylation domain-containing protein